jgi:hypothetical protein
VGPISRLSAPNPLALTLPTPDHSNHPVTQPEHQAAAVAPQPFSPDWRNGLTDAEKQSPEMRKFSERMHNDGAEHVSWLAWHYQDKQLWTPHMALWRQGSIFFLDCDRGPFAVTADHVFEQFCVVDWRKAPRCRN